MKKIFVQNAFLAGVVLALAGCASGYQQFYKPVQGATPERIASLRTGPAPAMPAVERSQPRNDPALIETYMRRGYSAIGYASFTSGRTESEDAALRQAKEVGADLVLIFDPKYAGSTTTNVPITLPTTSTAYTTGTATAYGAGGTVTAHGNATTTTYGSTTSIIPITVNRSSYGAVFFIKQHYRLGLIVRDLNNDERRALQTNKGVVVRVVVDGTPAFDADLLVGDIITSVDGEAVSTGATFNALFAGRKGKTVTIKFIRGTQAMEKSVTVGA
jgi:hypothetical protein